jgi:hypothetical protein
VNSIHPEHHNEIVDYVVNCIMCKFIALSSLCIRILAWLSRGKLVVCNSLGGKAAAWSSCAGIPSGEANLCAARVPANLLQTVQWRVLARAEFRFVRARVSGVLFDRHANLGRRVRLSCRYFDIFIRLYYCECALYEAAESWPRRFAKSPSFHRTRASIRS